LQFLASAARVVRPDANITLKMETNGSLGLLLVAFDAIFLLLRFHITLMLEMPAFNAVQNSSSVNDSAQLIFKVHILCPNTPPMTHSSAIVVHSQHKH
jgi:hypothetical protein